MKIGKFWFWLRGWKFDWLVSGSARKLRIGFLMVQWFV